MASAVRSRQGELHVTKNARALALVGDVPIADEATIAEAAGAVGMDIVRVDGPRDLPAAIEKCEPAAILIPTEGEGAFESCVEVRSRRRYAHTPILGFTSRRSNVSFVEMYQWGGDD